MNKLFQRSKQLETDARQIFSELKLREYFRPYGEARLVGSVVYGLMSWEDLDIDLITEKEPSDELFWNTAKYLMTNKNTKLLSLADNRSGVAEIDRPKSIYLGVKYDYNGVIWKIDIRLIERKKINNLPKWMKDIDKITKDQKINILKIKEKLKGNDDYHHSISSIDVYDAVINKDIGSYGEFVETLGN